MTQPRAVCIWSAAALVVVLATTNPVYRVLVAAAGVAFLAASGRRGMGWRRLAMGLALMVATGMVLNAVLSHAGDDLLFSLPAAIPVLGGRYTLESLAFGASAGVGIAASILAVAPLSLVLEPSQVAEALPAPLARAGAAVASSLNLVPALSRSFAAVHEAQRLRGWRPGWRSLPEVATPALLTAIEDSVELAEAMEARGFGSGRRTSLGGGRWSGGDVAVAVAALLVAAFFLLARPADWYAYPALTRPPVEPLAVAVCLALFLPALRWPRWHRSIA
jgi:energy-coupling factor transport system permease protein